MALPLKLFIVDDAVEPIAVWAVNASQAKRICREAHGPTTRGPHGEVVLLPFVAAVTPFPMPDVKPPRKAGLEERQEVLDAVSADPRLLGVLEK